MSRKRVTINLAQVETFAEEGLSYSEIAAAIGIARSSFYKAMERNPDISDTIARGRSKLVRECVSIILNAARGGEWKAGVMLLEKYGDIFRGEAIEEPTKAGLGLLLPLS